MNPIEQGGTTSFWTTVPGVLTAIAGVVTAIGTLIAAMAAAGLFGGPDLPPQPAQPSSSVVPQQAVSTEEPELADIDLVYAGDNYGCGLALSVTVGDQPSVPSANRFTMRNVPTGVQEYSMTGTIACPTIGTCNASGSGTIDVDDGREYRIVWINTAVGHCNMVLQG